MSLSNPQTDRRQNGADYSQITELQYDMEKLLNELDQQAVPYAKACQVSEFLGDRRKTTLAEAFVAVRSTDAECGAGEAEHRARASAGFKEAMKGLIRDEIAAQTTKTLFHVLQTRLDVKRSFLACERAKIERGL
jgi:hypothetical protein